MIRPFEGVKILDFTQVLAGPYASYQLALLGEPRNFLEVRNEVSHHGLAGFCVRRAQDCGGV